MSQIFNLYLKWQFCFEVLQEVFQYADQDASGTINGREMQRILEKLNVKMSRSQLEKLMRDADLDSKKLR